ncbi:MAG: ABC transporter permease subunit, partial [bacterium]
RNVAAITARELKSYFVSPVAYAVGFFFLLILGGWFYFITVSSQHDASLRGTLSVLSYLCIPVAAVITMHLFSDERRSGTIELLMTFPVNDWEVVAGKFLASFLLYLFVLVLTIQYPIFLGLFGSPDWGIVLSGYLGAFLLGAAFVSVGVLSSALTRNSMVAALICLLVLFAFRFLSAGSLIEGPLGKVFYYLSFSGQYNNFSNGLIDTRDIVYFATFIIFSLFTAVRIVEINRWK